MRIRAPTLDDAHCIATVHVAAWRGGYTGVFPDSLLDTLSVDKRSEMWASAIQAGSPAVLVAECGAKIVGFIAFGKSRDAGAAEADKEIWAINLAPAHWSKGIGRALMLAARDALLKTECSSLSLWVVEQNLRARRFYEALGLRVVEDSRKPLRMGGFEGFEIRYAWQTTVAA